MAEADYARRLTDTRVRMAETGLDGLLVVNQHNRRYLTGFTHADGDFNESAGWVLVTPHTFGLITGTFHLNGLEHEIVASGAQLLLNDDAHSWDVAAKAVAGDGVRRLGFEKDWLSYDRYDRLRRTLAAEVELMPSDDLVKHVRARKDEAEIAVMRRAAQIGDRAFARLVERIRVGMTERAIATLLEDLLLEEGAEGTSFPTIVAVGPGGALPHAVPGNTPVTIGAPILIDFGCRVEGYCSDCTRTFCVGEPDPRLTELYGILHAAQDAAVAALRAGVRRGRDVDAAARQVIASAGYDTQFIHGLGHGVGLAIHEYPSLNRLKIDTPEQDTELAGVEIIPEPTVVTNEPGIYIAGWGGVRLEDMLLVRDSAVEILTARNPPELLRLPV